MAKKEQPTKTMRFQGLGLDLWFWPMVNLLLSLLAARRRAENIEKVKMIRDPRTGDLVAIEVYREVNG